MPNEKPQNGELDFPDDDELTRRIAASAAECSKHVETVTPKKKPRDMTPEERKAHENELARKRYYRRKARLEAEGKEPAHKGKSLNLPAQAGLKTTAEIAQMYHTSPDNIRRWINAGCPVAKRAHGRGKAHLMDVAEVDAWRKSTQTKYSEINPQEERALLDRAKRINLELKNAVLQGDYLPVTVTQAAIQSLFTAIKSRLMALPVRLAPVLQASSSVHETQEILRDAIRTSLIDLASDAVLVNAATDAAAEIDSVGVGGEISETEPGSERGTGKLE